MSPEPQYKPIFNIPSSISSSLTTPLPPQLVGAPCGHHGQYTFYKALRLTGASEKIIAIGDFFFVRVWQDSELVSIGNMSAKQYVQVPYVKGGTLRKTDDYDFYQGLNLIRIAFCG